MHEVVVRNQFGDQTLLTGKRAIAVCVPSDAGGVPSASTIDHFRCYKARFKKGTRRVAAQTVTLADQFETKAETITDKIRFCNPVDKNGEGIPDPTAHLTCYRLTDTSGIAPFTPQNVATHDQFGDLTLRVRPIAVLCAPSLKLSDVTH